MSREKWQTAVSNKITVLIIHTFPTSSDSFPFISPCSNGWHQAFVKVKVARPTPGDTTDQFFHLFRSASLLLLSVQFQHLEAMPKCKASRNVREISLINERPRRWLLRDSLLFWLALRHCWCKQLYWCVRGAMLECGYQSMSSTSDMMHVFLLNHYIIHEEKARKRSVLTNYLQCDIFISFCKSIHSEFSPMTSMLLQRFSKPANLRVSVMKC